MQKRTRYGQNVTNLLKISVIMTLGGLYMLKKQFNYKYFNRNEFADKISGANKISPKLIKMLDKAREIAGVPFIINSGYRDENHPESLSNPTSSHIKGLAVDIAVNPSNREIIKQALIKVGFTRFGFGSNFIHVDIDYSKTQKVAWYYDGRATQYNYSEVV